MPSTVRPFSVWKSLTAASVCGPNLPSAPILAPSDRSLFCNSTTAVPLSPNLSTGRVPGFRVVVDLTVVVLPVADVVEPAAEVDVASPVVELVTAPLVVVAFSVVDVDELSSPPHAANATTPAPAQHHRAILLIIDKPILSTIDLGPGPRGPCERITELAARSPAEPLG